MPAGEGCGRARAGARQNLPNSEIPTQERFRVPEPARWVQRQLKEEEAKHRGSLNLPKGRPEARVVEGGAGAALKGRRRDRCGSPVPRLEPGPRECRLDLAARYCGRAGRAGAARCAFSHFTPRGDAAHPPALPDFGGDCEPPRSHAPFFPCHGGLGVRESAEPADHRRATKPALVGDFEAHFRRRRGRLLRTHAPSPHPRDTPDPAHPPVLHACPAENPRALHP